MATAAANVRAIAPPSWSGIVRAMAQTGGASLASGFLSLLAVKIVAIVLGPAHVALLSSLQQLRQTAVTGATLTGQTALVQGASALTGRKRREFLRTSFVLIMSATLLTCTLMIMLPGWFARQAGLPSDQYSMPTTLVLAVVPSVAFVFLTAIMNASGTIGRLALVQLAAPAGMAVLAYPVARGIAQGNHDLLVVILALSSIGATIAAGTALYLERERLSGWLSGDGRWWDMSAVRHFFKVSGSMLLSGIFSSWIVLAVRGNVLRSEGLTVGGEFDAAWAISMNQAGLVLASLQSYYLPALAKTTDTAQRASHIGRVLTVAALAGAAFIAVLAVLKPVLIAGFYTEQFLGAARYLRWTLIGDYFKITSWILSIPLIATARMQAFLVADLIAYGSFAAAAWGLTHWFGAAESASMAFTVMYAIHMLFCGVWLYRRSEFRLDRHIAAMWAAGFGIVVLSSAVFWEQI